MLTFTKGNIFSSKAQTLTCPVNCKGVMGKGLALEFKKWFPGLFDAYKRACDKGDVAIGRPWMFQMSDVRQVLCFATKDHWKNPSTYEYIDLGLETLKNHYDTMGIASLALPPLGCGLGGLEWNEVKPMIEKHLGQLSIPIEIFEP
jgi:O-acetyl-ADP-ribose deacetylase (regulator of RNase III)